MADADLAQKQLPQALHLVFGGELTAVDRVEFAAPDRLDTVGIYPDYQSAYDAWKEVSQRHIDNALMRYFIVDVQSLMLPQG
jgi:hypothetical protein